MYMQKKYIKNKSRITLKAINRKNINFAVINLIQIRKITDHN